MSVGYLPYGMPAKKFAKIADIPLENVQWPLGEIDPTGRVGDLSQNDHLVMCMSSRALLVNRAGLKCRLSLMLFEPPAIHARYYRILPFLSHRYHRIFTYNRKLQRLPNARFQAHGGTALSLPIQLADKTARIAMIASKKKTTAGHRLRHVLADWSRASAPDLALLGRGYSPLENKADGHTPFMFSVVLENCREPGYFTEKLIDSFLCLSLPIYWGAPDVAEFFDPRGMIVCTSQTELSEAITRIDANEYAQRLPYLRENCERAKQFLDPWLSLAEFLVAEDQIEFRKSALAANEIRAA